MAAPIFSRPRFLPDPKSTGAQIDHAVVSDGCIINHAVITHSIAGLRSIVGAGTIMQTARSFWQLTVLRIPRVDRLPAMNRPASRA